MKTASEKISEAVKSKMDPIPSIELQIKQEDYILAIRSLGATDFRIIFFHVLKNALPWAMRAYRLQPPT